MKLSRATLVAFFLAQHASASPVAGQHLGARDGSALQCHGSRCAVAKVKRAEEPSRVDIAARTERPPQVQVPGDRPQLPPRQAEEEVADETTEEAPTPAEIAARADPSRLVKATYPAHGKKLRREAPDATEAEAPTPVELAPRDDPSVLIKPRPGLDARGSGADADEAAGGEEEERPTPAGLAPRELPSLIVRPPKRPRRDAALEGAEEAEEE